MIQHLDSDISLKNQLLIAMPAMQDPNFKQSVIYIVEHNEEGAMGIMINQALDVKLVELFEQLDIVSHHPELNEQPVLFGGPLQCERGFILHSPIANWKSSLMVNDDMALTTSRDILEALINKKGPQQYLICLGYAGWDKDQLEEEITDNCWLCAPISKQLIFETPINERWQAAATSIGIGNFNNMSFDVGHA